MAGMQVETNNKYDIIALTLSSKEDTNSFSNAVIIPKLYFLTYILI